MPRAILPVLRSAFTVFVLCALAACGARPAADDTSGTAATPAPAAGAEVADAPVAEGSAGRNAGRIVVDGQTYEFRSDQGGLFRGTTHDAPDIEVITLESYTEANDLYAKVVFNVAKGASPEGEYVAGILGNPEHRTSVGHGQVTLAVEKDPAVGRRMFPSGSGRFTVTRVGDQYRVDFEIGGDGQFRAADAPMITGYLQVADSPQ